MPSTAELNAARKLGHYKADYAPATPAPGTATQQAYKRLRGMLPLCGFTECGDGAFYLPAQPGAHETRVRFLAAMVVVEAKRPGRKWVRTASARFLELEYYPKSVRIGDATYMVQA